MEEKTGASGENLVNFKTGSHWGKIYGNEKEKA